MKNHQQTEGHNAEKRTRTILYTRVKNPEDCFTENLQKMRLEEYCIKHGIEGAVYYNFVGRAVEACTTSEIESLCRFAAQHAASTVVITRLDLICRDLFAYIRLRDTLRRYKISLICLDQNVPDDEFVDTIEATAKTQ